MPERKTDRAKPDPKTEPKRANRPDPGKKSGPSKELADKYSPNDFYRYSGMAIKMAVVIFAGVYGGMKLDERWNLSTPWMTIVLSLVGVAASIYIVIRDTSPR